MKTLITLSRFKAAVKDLSKSGVTWDGLQITVTEDGVTMTAGKNPSVQKRVEAVTINPGKVTVSFDTLKKITPKLKGKDMVLLEIKDDKLEVTCGKTSLSINTVDSMIIDFKPGATFNIDTSDFISGIKKVVHSTSKQASRPVLQAVKMAVNEGQLKMVSTDSHRLAEVITPTMDDVTIDGSMLPLATELKKIYTLSWGDTLKVGMTVSGHHMIISDDLGTVAYISVSEGIYPDTDRLMPTSHTSTLHATVSDLLEAAETAEIVLKSNDTRNNYMLLNLMSGVSLLSAEGQCSHIKIELDQYDGDEISIAFNPTYFKEALKTFDKDDTVELGFTSSIKPFTLASPGNIHLITPIRTGR